MSYDLTKFKHGLEELRITLTDHQIEQFLQYYEMLVEKNKVMNLTGITEYEEVKEFVHAAEKCDFDIDVFYNRIIIDAKSMLGVLSLDLSRELTVKYGGKNNAFENVLCKYACA